MDQTLFEKEAKEIMEKISTPEAALNVLEDMVYRKPITRSNGKTMMSLIVDVALMRAIESLRKEIAIKDSAICCVFNKNTIWVTQDVYERIVNNPNGVIFEAVGQAPIMWSGRKRKEKKNVKPEI